MKRLLFKRRPYPEKDPLLMPRLKVPTPEVESRKALEQRAREAAKPLPPEQKGRWPFSVQDNQPAGEANGHHGESEKPAGPGKPRG